MTAAHVIDGYRGNHTRENVVAPQLGDIPVDFEDRNAIIASDAGLDMRPLVSQ